MKDFKKVVAHRIKAARIAAGYASQAALADAINVDQSRVARWEVGEYQPRGELRSRLLKAIRKTELDIFGVAEPAQAKTAPDILEAIREGAATVLGGDLSPDKQKLIALIRDLPDSRVRTLLDIAQVDTSALLDDDEELPASTRRRR